jgi:hypothetical protein
MLLMDQKSIPQKMKKKKRGILTTKDEKKLFL